MGEGSHRFEPLGRHHDRAAFSCGNAILDRYLQRQARQDVDRRVAAVFVLLDAETERIVGYYTLSAGAVEPSELPPEVTRRLPPYRALPVVLLGRLAVDARYQGRGFGALLLVDALPRALAHSAQVAAMAVIVDAIDEQARRFYERFGFRRFVDDEDRLFIPMGTIEQL